MGGGRFTTLGCSGCQNVAHHLLGFWGGGRGLRLTTLAASDSYNVSSHAVLIMCHKTTLHGSTF